MRRLVRAAKTATLSSLNRKDGIPYGSLANIATAIGGEPLILISRLAWHTQNLAADNRASILVSALPATGDALVGERVTVMGLFLPTDDADLRARYLAQHPEAMPYAGFADFGLWRLEPSLVHGIAGFGRIENYQASAVFPDASEIAATAASAVQHLNAEHADAVALYARVLLGARPGAWRVSAVDSDGCDLTLGDEVLRLDFPEPALTASALRQSFAGLSAKARAARI
jgi:putative heme iron utilization protein